MEFDVEKIVDIVTGEILRRLRDAGECEQGGQNELNELNTLNALKVLVTEGCPADIVSGGYSGVHGCDAGSCKYVVLTAEAYNAFARRGGTGVLPPSETAPCCDGGGLDGCRGETVDLRGKRLLHERDLRENNVGRGMVVKVSKRTIVTALANDYAKGQGARIVREN
jgi:hypothetical protein